jgi:hypothetical protein
VQRRWPYFDWAIDGDDGDDGDAHWKTAKFSRAHFPNATNFLSQKSKSLGKSAKRKDFQF